MVKCLCVAFHTFLYGFRGRKSSTPIGTAVFPWIPSHRFAHHQQCVVDKNQKSLNSNMFRVIDCEQKMPPTCTMHMHPEKTHHNFLVFFPNECRNKQFNNHPRASHWAPCNNLSKLNDLCIGQKMSICLWPFVGDGMQQLISNFGPQITARIIHASCIRDYCICLMTTKPHSSYNNDNTCWFVRPWVF